MSSSHLKTLRLGISLLLLALAGLVPLRQASAQIKQPNAHPDYRLELEPHLLMSVFRRGFVEFDKAPKKHGYFGVPGFGGGLQASIEIADPAFIPRLNNTVGITLGVDVTSCEPCSKDVSLLIPLALQWNFFFSKEFSASGEIGPMLRTDGFFSGVVPDLWLMATGRYHFNDGVALSLGLGYPGITLGVSFFTG